MDLTIKEAHVIKHKQALRGALTLAVAVGVAVGALTGNDVPRRNAAATVAAAESTDTADHARLRALLHRLTTVDGGPGALVEVRDRRGSAVLTSGVADVKSHAPVRRDSRFRIGSMTAQIPDTAIEGLGVEVRQVMFADGPLEA